jgi:excisionase family DNA binding protein
LFNRDFHNLFLGAQLDDFWSRCCALIKEEYEKQTKAVTTSILEATLTSQDLQELLQVSGSTIDRLVESHRLPEPFRLGRRRRWKVSDIEEFMGRRSDELANGPRNQS